MPLQSLKDSSIGRPSTAFRLFKPFINVVHCLSDTHFKRNDPILQVLDIPFRRASRSRTVWPEGVSREQGQGGPDGASGRGDSWWLINGV
jgi:hypothetical protein